MHGGTNRGAPIGNRNARKHGRYSAEAVSFRRQIAELVKLSRETLRDLR